MNKLNIILTILFLISVISVSGVSDTKNTFVTFNIGSSNFYFIGSGLQSSDASQRFYSGSTLNDCKSGTPNTDIVYYTANTVCMLDTTGERFFIDLSKDSTTPIKYYYYNVNEVSPTTIVLSNNGLNVDTLEVTTYDDTTADIRFTSTNNDSTTPYHLYDNNPISNNGHIYDYSTTATTPCKEFTLGMVGSATAVFNPYTYSDFCYNEQTTNTNTYFNISSQSDDLRLIVNPTKEVIKTKINGTINSFKGKYNSKNVYFKQQFYSGDVYEVTITKNSSKQNTNSKSIFDYFNDFYNNGVYECSIANYRTSFTNCFNASNLDHYQVGNYQYSINNDSLTIRKSNTGSINQFGFKNTLNNDFYYITANKIYSTDGGTLENVFSNNNFLGVNTKEISLKKYATSTYYFKEELRINNNLLYTTNRYDKNIYSDSEVYYDNNNLYLDLYNDTFNTTYTTNGLYAGIVLNPNLAQQSMASIDYIGYSIAPNKNYYNLSIISEDNNSIKYKLSILNDFDNTLRLKTPFSTNVDVNFKEYVQYTPPNNVLISSPFGSYVLNSTGVILKFNYSSSASIPLSYYDVYLTNNVLNYPIKLNTSLTNFNKNLSSELITYSDSYYVKVIATNTVGNSTTQSNNTLNLCINNWVSNTSTCINDSQVKTYTDTNTCSEQYDVPNDNNTIITCDDGILSNNEVLLLEEQGRTNRLLLVLSLLIIFSSVLIGIGVINIPLIVALFLEVVLIITNVFIISNIDSGIYRGVIIFGIVIQAIMIFLSLVIKEK